MNELPMRQCGQGICVRCSRYPWLRAKLRPRCRCGHVRGGGPPTHRLNRGPQLRRWGMEARELIPFLDERPDRQNSGDAVGVRRPMRRRRSCRIQPPLVCAMHSIYSRFNNVTATISTTVMVLLAAIALPSFVFTPQPTGSPDVSSVNVSAVTFLF